MKKTFISVIIPVYNRDKLISRAIESVLNQTFEDWEVIVVDDGSTDNTVKQVNKLAESDSRIRLVQNKSNLGFLQARNVGIAEAKSDWILLLDSDDSYLPDAFESIVKGIKTYGDQYQSIQFLIKTNSNRLPFLGYKTDGDWETYTPKYEEVVLKQDLVGDMHRVNQKKMMLDYPYPKSNPGLENLYYADLAKTGYKTIYINKPVVLVDIEGGERHSVDRIKKWPKEFAQAYSDYLKRHGDVLRSDSDKYLNTLILGLKSFWYSKNYIEFIKFAFMTGRHYFVISLS